MNLNDLIVYARGEFRRYDDARVGLLTHGLNYGTGCFEGIRGYWNADDRELYLLQLRDHYDRLATSTKILFMTLPHTTDELIDITVELCQRNGFKENVYLRPLAFKSSEDVGVRLLDVEEAFVIIGVPYKGYFAPDEGLKVCVSSWRRAEDTIAPARAKITGNYVNSALAKSDAQSAGFDEAILLSHDGHVSEGSAENVFLVKGGVLYTPDAAQNILEGVTRRCVITLAQNELGMPVIERAIDRSELYGAEEVFFTGTAAGIVHASSIDHRRVGDGKRGPVARALMELYGRIVLGREPAYRSWLTPAFAGRRVEA